MSKDVLERAVDEYNRFRSPEAVVRVLERGENGFVAEFSGSFCMTCGVYDWLEDLAYEIRRLDPGLEVELVDWKRVSDDTIVAEFRFVRKAAR